MDANFAPQRAMEEIRKAFIETETAQTDALQQTKDVQVILGSLLQHEAKRLEKKLGKSNRRVQQVQSSFKRNLNIVRDLEGELEIARIKEPEVDPKSTLIHGRVVDENYRGLASLSIYLESEPGKIIRSLGSAETNASGYYALQIESRVLAKLKELAPEGVFLIVCTSNNKLLYRKPEPLQLKEGDTPTESLRDRILVEEIVLNRADLSPVGGKQPTEPEQPNEDKTPPPSNVGVVRGRVTNETGQGVPKLRVSAIEENRRYDDKLGVTLTDEKGEFSITYPVPEGQQSGPNLYVTVIDANGKLLYSSADKIRRNASQEEVFEINLKVSDRPNREQ